MTEGSAPEPVHTTYETESSSANASDTPGQHEQDNRDVVWFDIDNTLYSASTRIADAMGKRIHDYFLSLGLDDDEATTLHHKYYREYGLALRGLVRHHNVDTLDFNSKCDGSLPLEDMIKPDKAVRELIQDINRSKVKVCALTNAYVTHARRVLRILEIEDLIETVVYCDYANPNFSCKPEAQFFHEALTKVGINDTSRFYFIDDSLPNVLAAVRLGWGHCVYFCENDSSVDTKPTSVEVDGKTYTVVSSLLQLRSVWPEIFN